MGEEQGSLQIPPCYLPDKGHVHMWEKKYPPRPLRDRSQLGFLSRDYSIWDSLSHFQRTNLLPPPFQNPGLGI